MCNTYAEEVKKEVQDKFINETKIQGEKIKMLD